MRFIITIISVLLIFCVRPGVAEEEPAVSKIFTKTYRAYSTAYNNGNYPRAAELAQKLLEMGLEELGEEHEKIPVLQINLAHVLLAIGRHEEAEPALTAAQQSMLERLGSEHPDLIPLHENQARLYLSKQEPEQARLELDRIIAIITGQRGARNPAIADVMVQQANIDIAMQELDRGEAAYREALAIYDESLGEGSIRAADVISLLGDIDLARKALAEAEQKYEEALRIYQENLLEDDPIVLANHSRLARLYVALRDDRFAGHADKFIRHTPHKDGPATPLFLMKPLYPVFESGERPAGWALVEFKVSAEGRVLEPKIIESRPGRLFDQVSLEVAPKWRFKPKVVAGQPVVQEKTRVRLLYNKNDIEIYAGELI